MSMAAKEAGKAAGAELAKIVGKELLQIQDGTEAKLNEIIGQLKQLEQDVARLQSSVDKGFFDVALTLYNNEYNDVGVRHTDYLNLLKDCATLRKELSAVNLTETEKANKSAALQTILGTIKEQNTYINTNTSIKLANIHGQLVGAAGSNGLILQAVNQAFTKSENLLTCYVQTRSWFLDQIANQVKGVSLLQWAALPHVPTGKEAPSKTEDRRLQELYNRLDLQEASFTAAFGKNNSELARAVIERPNQFQQICLRSITRGGSSWVTPESNWREIFDVDGSSSHYRWVEWMQFSDVPQRWALRSREYQDPSRGIDVNAIYTFDIRAGKNMLKTCYRSGRFSWYNVKPGAFGWRLKPMPNDTLMIVYADGDMFADGNNHVWDASDTFMFLKPGDSKNPNQLYQMSWAGDWVIDRINQDHGIFMPGLRMFSQNKAFYFEIDQIDYLPKIYKADNNVEVWRFRESEKKPDVPIGLWLPNDKPQRLSLVRYDTKDCFWYVEAPKSAPAAELVLGNDGCLRFQAGGNVLWYSSRPIFRPIYAQGEPGNGIGGFDLKSPHDRAIAFDWTGKGKLDHLLLSRNYDQTILYVLENVNGTWTPKYQDDNFYTVPQRPVAFDFDSNGKMDHVLFYGGIGPSKGTIGIFKLQENKQWVWGTLTDGIGGYDLTSEYDRLIAFDYEHSGKLDHIVAYRPGSGICYILKNEVKSSWKFTPLYKEVCGIGGYDLKSWRDRIIAFDWDSSGKMDHLVLYRPNEGILFVLKNTNGEFQQVYATWSGVGGYDLKSPFDRVIAYDYNGTGKRDHLVIYRPSRGNFWCLRRAGDSFSAVYTTEQGLAGYNLNHHSDQIFAMDAEKSGRERDLVAYRRNGSGTIWIQKRIQ